MWVRVLLAVGAVIVSGCSPATRTATTTMAATTTTATTTATTAAATVTTTTGPPTFPAPSTRNWFEFEPGDCLTALPQIELGDVAVPVVDCSAPHVAEVCLRVPVEVDAAVTGVADQKCRAGLPGFTGGRTAYSVTYLIDSNMDRTGHTPLPSTVICLLQNANGQPMAGSARR